MKKRLLALSMAMIMAAGSLTACGGDTAATPAETETPAATEAAATEAPAEGGEAAATEAPAAEAPAADEGSVLKIQVWNDEFINRVKDHYPGYEEVDATHGKIGDVSVEWVVTANQDNAYQNNLDAVLPGNADAAADDKTDIFLVEADYALKYVNAAEPVAMALTDLGITDADLSKQYQYTKDIVTDANGVLRGSSWQACSAGLIYNRDVALEVLGTEEPAEVQEFVKDWDSFNATAEKLGAAGYKVEATVNDSYRVYSNNVSAPWVDGNKVVIDANIDKWVDDSKALVDAGYTGTGELWGDEWNKGFRPDGKVFAYFGPAWFFNFCMGAGDEGTVANAGRWGLTTGPQGFFWGGTWICAAVGTDNPTLVKDIILTMTANDDVMKDIAQKDMDCVNNTAVLAELAADESGNVALLGGQNPYEMLAKGAELVDMSKISPYDQGCNEEFQAAMKNYFLGKASKEEAIAEFNKAITEKYPELVTE